MSVEEAMRGPSGATVGADISDRARKSDKTTVYITPDLKRKLARLAKHLGYLTPTGPGAGEIGNVSALLRAIAAEEIDLRRVEDSEEEGARD
jgi:hypothetical protein